MRQGRETAGSALKSPPVLAIRPSIRWTGQETFAADREAGPCFMPWSHGMEAPHGMLRAGEVFWLKNLAVDDERLALQLLTDAIQAVLPKAEVFAFSKPGEALSCARENRCDIAFLDVRMWSMAGLELARKLKGL